ncbi:MAG: penicillin-binding protein 2 [Acidimicrobiales bacterium]
MNDSQPLRLTILGIVAIALFTALISRLWFLQVMAAPEYSAQADINRTRTIVVEGPRGRILDRNGAVLAENRESVVVTVDSAALDRSGERDEVLSALEAELTRAGSPVTVPEIEARIARWEVRGDPFRPAVVAEDVNPDLWVTLGERTAVLPGVEVEKTYRREYPYGSLGAHVLGYVGEINETEIEQVRNSAKPYRPGDSIGKAGVEQMFEEFLRGTPGRVVFEVDSVGRVVGIVAQEDPEPGSDLRLALDIDLQGVTERALEDEMIRARSTAQGRNDPAPPAPAGSAVVIDPRNGELLAMASYPTFDPNELTAGISTERWAELTGRETYSPLTNRAIRNPYQVGSTFKLFSGYTAATTGLRAPGFAIDDQGSYTLQQCEGQCTFRNANNAIHGLVDLPRAMEVSSNVYFYQVGEAFWRQRNVYGDTPVQDFAAQLGIGSSTGIALPLDNGGVLMTPELKRTRHEANPEAFPDGSWLVGDNVYVAIGQSDIGVTPLQLANAYGAFGNGGTLHAPNVVLDIRDPATGEVLRTYAPRVTNQVDLDPAIHQVMTDGLVRVTRGERGTATAVYRGFPHDGFSVAGKTGTAQVGGNRRSSSVFAAWAPAENPRYAISVIVEEGGFGSRVAAPISRRILEPLAERDLYGTPIIAAPRRGETVEDDVPDIDLGNAYD